MAALEDVVAGGAKLPDGRKHDPPVPQQDADIFEVLIGQVAKGRESDPVLGEATGRTRTCRAFRANPQSAASELRPCGP